MEKVYIIDGHNVIFSTPDLRSLHRQNEKGTRSLLVKTLTDFQDLNEVSVVLVFDGKGRSRTLEPRQERDIMVIYSRSGQSADAVIESLAAKYSGSYDINVVSNDRAVVDAVSSSGAHAMSVRAMWEIL